jgi:hypothetical protein
LSSHNSLFLYVQNTNPSDQSVITGRHQPDTFAEDSTATTVAAKYRRRQQAATQSTLFDTLLTAKAATYRSKDKPVITVAEDSTATTVAAKYWRRQQAATQSSQFHTICYSSNRKSSNIPQQGQASHHR